MITPATQENLDIFIKKVEILSKHVNKADIARVLWIAPPNLHKALEGNCSIRTYLNYNSILDEYTREIIGDMERVLEIRRF